MIPFFRNQTIGKAPLLRQQSPHNSVEVVREPKIWPNSKKLKQTIESLKRWLVSMSKQNRHSCANQARSLQRLHRLAQRQSAREELGLKLASARSSLTHNQRLESSILSLNDWAHPGSICKYYQKYKGRK